MTSGKYDECLKRLEAAGAGNPREGFIMFAMVIPIISW
jgi:hypothetical protein